MKRKNNEYYIFYIKENVLIFDTFKYIEELAAETVDFMFEWNVVNDNKIIFNKKMIKTYLKEKIQKDLNEMKKFSSKINCDTFSFFQQKNFFNELGSFFQNPLEFIVFCKKICKKELPNFIENKQDINLFQEVNGFVFDIPCLIPSGEDEEFLQKYLKNIQKTY